MSEMRAIIEFYRWGDASFILRLETAATPPGVGEKINIRATDYCVMRVDYSVDYVDAIGRSNITYRRNVYLQPVKPKVKK